MWSTPMALAKAFSGGSVYSLHKSSTRRHVGKIAAAWGVRAEVVAAPRWGAEISVRLPGGAPPRTLDEGQD